MRISQPRPTRVYSPVRGGRAVGRGLLAPVLLICAGLLVHQGCGGNRGGAAVDAEGSGGMLGPPTGSDARAPYCGEATRPLSFVHKQSDVLVVFDRSGSMARAFGLATRFDAAQALLTDVLHAYQDRVNFGFQQFPRPGGCGGEASPSRCCAQAPSVPVSLLAAERITEAIAAAAPVDGNTPTAQALRAAGEFYAGWSDGITERYVLLATDGQPSCLADGTLAKDIIVGGQRVQGPCLDALRAVHELQATGIKVIVLGIGSELSLGPQGGPSCLEELARAGGAAREAVGGPAFFSAGGPKELERALQRIFGAVVQPSCTISFSERAPDPANVAVFFDDQQVPFDARGVSGWHWVVGGEGHTLQVFGPLCDQLERLNVQKVDIRYGCRPCDTPGSCQ